MALSSHIEIYYVNLVPSNKTSKYRLVPFIKKSSRVATWWYIELDVRERFLCDTLYTYSDIWRPGWLYTMTVLAKSDTIYRIPVPKSRGGNRFSTTHCIKSVEISK